MPYPQEPRQPRLRGIHFAETCHAEAVLQTSLRCCAGRSISAACAGKSHVHNPVQAVPDPEYDAAIAASRAHGLLSTYQELVLMAEAFQRQQAVGHELLAHAGPSQRGPADFRTPAMERMEAVGQAREALDVAMRNGMAPVGSEAYSQLCRAADPSLQADDVAYPSVAISGSKVCALQCLAVSTTFRRPSSNMLLYPVLACGPWMSPCGTQHLQQVQ